MKAKLPRLIPAAIALCVALIYTVTFTVGPSEAAVVETLGRITRVLESPTDEGLHFKLPWPIQKVFSFDTRLQIHKGPLTEVSTSDGQTLVTGAFLFWRIADPRKFREATGGDLARTRALLRGPLNAALAEAFSNIRFSDLVALPIHSTKGAQPQREAFSERPDRLLQVERKIKDLLKVELDSYGIEPRKVGFYQLLVPSQAVTAIFDHMKQVKQEEASRIESIAEAESERIKAEASVEYEKIMSEARREAAAIRAKAYAETQELISGSEEKSFLLFLEKLDALKEFLSKKTTLVVGPNTPPFDIFKYLETKLLKTEETGSGERGAR